MLSSHSFVLYVSPVSVRSTHGVPTASAAGNGRPSSLARKIIASTMPAPAELPKSPSVFGSFVSAIAFHTFMQSFTFTLLSRQNRVYHFSPPCNHTPGGL